MSDTDDKAWLEGATVLVTGATGRIGGRLARELLAAGTRVRTVVLPDDTAADTLPPDIEVVVGSLSDSGVVADAVEGVDGVVHLAAFMDWGPDVNPALFESNVSATFLLLERLAQQSNKVHKIVIASSDEIYPALDVVGEIVEDLPARPYSFYGLTKQLDEVMADFYHRAHDLPVVVTRFSLTADADEIARHDGWSGRLFFATGLRGILDAIGRPTAVAAIDAAVDNPDKTLVLARDSAGVPYQFQFCDSRDLVAGLICLLVEPNASGGTFNLSGPGPLDYADVVPRLASALDIPYVDLCLDGPRINVCTNTDRVRSVAGFQPSIGIEEILGELGGDVGS